MPNYSSLYSGLAYQFYRYETQGDVTNIDNLIKKLVENNKTDGIICLTMVPRKFLGYYEGGTPVINEANRSKTKTVSINSNIDGYVPKNNKLFTYPYNFLCVDCLSDTHNYKYELFTDSSSMEFNLLFVLEPNPSIMITPKSYNNLHVPASYNYTESLIMDGFPQCAAAIDNYRAWLAMNANANSLDKQQAGLGIASGLLTAGGGAAVTVGGALMGNIGMAAAGATMMLGGGKSAISSSIDMQRAKNEDIVASTKGSTLRGTHANGARMSARCTNVYFKQMCVKQENARVIDDFFTRYGYAINRVQTPNLNARKTFTYIKTNGCVLRGNIPSEDITKIKAIFDRGVTFFNDIRYIGEYDRDNSIE